MTVMIRVDHEVQAELLRRRLPGERNHSEPIRRALREKELETKLWSEGLVTDEMAELNWLRSVRGGL